MLVRNGRELDALPSGNNGWDACSDLDEECGRVGERELDIIIVPVQSAVECTVHSWTRMRCRAKAELP